MFVESCPVSSYFNAPVLVACTFKGDGKAVNVIIKGCKFKGGVDVLGKWKLGWMDIIIGFYWIFVILWEPFEEFAELKLWRAIARCLSFLLYNM